MLHNTIDSFFTIFLFTDYLYRNQEADNYYQTSNYNRKK